MIIAYLSLILQTDGWFVMHTIGNKQMNLLHLRVINDYEEELIEKKNGLVWILTNGVQLANNTFAAPS